jgi:N-acylneuraminate cytidylyltransferase
MSENKIAIIPARGGSKRIPRKNIKHFLDKPIIAYSIEVAIKSELFDEVMVSTDDEEIAEIALKFGALVPFKRSVKASDDYATTMDVINEVLNAYRTSKNRTFKFGCCIYPTAPLIQSVHLRDGFNKLKNEDYDCVFPVVDFGYPVWRGLELNDQGKIKLIWPEYLNERSQDLKKVYHDAGQWYWFRPERLGRSLFTDNTSSLILEENIVHDIDDLVDWKIAEIKYKALNAT